jgi:putative hemolysin
MNQIELMRSAIENIAVMSAAHFPIFQHSVPREKIREGRYLLRFARTRRELDAALKLRFDVFNLELGEGLESSFQTGRDMDEFDEACHHLIVLDRQNDEVVGTYRMQTGDMAAANRGFYSEGEYNLSSFPREALRDSVELGRACIAKAHRNTQVLFLLWKGLAAYLTHNRKRYLFGCCSLASQDEGEALRVMRMLERGGHLLTPLWATPRSGFECVAKDSKDSAADGTEEASIPKLFRAYLRFGAKVRSAPAIDRRFKTIDFLVLFDIREMEARTRRTFWGA